MVAPCERPNQHPHLLHPRLPVDPLLEGKRWRLRYGWQQDLLDGQPLRMDREKKRRDLQNQVRRGPETPSGGSPKLTTTPSRIFLGSGWALNLCSSSSGALLACRSWSLFSTCSWKPSGTVGSLAAGFFRSSAPSRIFLLSSSALNLNLMGQMKHWEIFRSGSNAGK